MYLHAVFQELSRAVLDLENLVGDMASRSPGAQPDRNESDAVESSLLREMHANNRQSINVTNTASGRVRSTAVVSKGVN